MIKKFFGHRDGAKHLGSTFSETIGYIIGDLVHVLLNTAFYIPKSLPAVDQQPTFPDTEHLGLAQSYTKMKINSFAIFGLLSLVSGGVARRGNRFRAYGSFSLKRPSGSLSLTNEYARIWTQLLTEARIDDNDPVEKKSRVTAFLNTDEGLKVECWEIGDLLPQNHVTRADRSK